MTPSRVLLLDEPAQRLAFYRELVGDLAVVSAPAAAGEPGEALQGDPALIVLSLATTAARVRAHPGTQRTPLLFVGPEGAAALPAQISGPIDFVPAAAAPALLRDRVRLFVELQRTGAELAQRNEQYLSIMLHELRTPLNAILGWTTLLRTGRVDAPTAERALETIERNARVQTQLIEALQDEARIVAGKVQLEPEEVDPRRVVETTLAAMTAAAEARQVTLASDFAEPVMRVRADSARLQQLLGHLLANAIQASPEGSQVLVRVASGPAELRISVTDTGCGIEPALLPLLFDRFRQDEGAAGRRRSGRGLGLTLVRRLAELHGGSVSAASPGEGQGATFTLRLPAGVTAPRAAPS